MRSIVALAAALAAPATRRSQLSRSERVLCGAAVVFQLVTGEGWVVDGAKMSLMPELEAQDPTPGLFPPAAARKPWWRFW